METGIYAWSTDEFGRHFAGAEIIGWRVEFRRGVPFRGLPFESLHRQRRRVMRASKFGVLRELIREGREWSGKVFFLEVYEMRPIYELHYEWQDDDE